VSTTYPAEASRDAAFPTSGRGDAEATYRKALRHSRRVRWLRYGVLTGIAAILIGLVVDNYLSLLTEIRLPGEMGKLVIKGTKITMQAPKIHGFTSDSRPYEFTANAAAQEINKPDIVELDQIHAKMDMEDKSTVELTAPSGTYDMKANTLTLNEDIVVVSSTGYAARLTEALVDMKTGNVVSDQPVKVKLLNGILNAKRMEIAEKGDVLHFLGGVSMTLHPDQNSK
jgi:lipopolysaccharide export system protein LptC